jgi:hypothetical protein
VERGWQLQRLELSLGGTLNVIKHQLPSPAMVLLLPERLNTFSGIYIQFTIH